MDYEKFALTLSTMILAGSTAFLGVRDCLRQKVEEGSYLLPSQLENVFQSSVRVDKKLTLEEECDGSNEVDRYGSGVLLRDFQTGDDYILTAEHVAPNEMYKCEEETPDKEIKVKSSHLYSGMNELSVIKENEKADIALLKILNSIEDIVPYQGKLASKLIAGDYVPGVGSPGESKKYFVANVKEKEDDVTILNVSIRGGNSGGPVYLVRDSKPLELIGVVISESGITSLERTREILVGTPLEDDYL